MFGAGRVLHVSCLPVVWTHFVPVLFYSGTPSRKAHETELITLLLFHCRLQSSYVPASFTHWSQSDFITCLLNKMRGNQGVGRKLFAPNKIKITIVIICRLVGAGFQPVSSLAFSRALHKQKCSNYTSFVVCTTLFKRKAVP